MPDTEDKRDDTTSADSRQLPGSIRSHTGVRNNGRASESSSHDDGDGEVDSVRVDLEENELDRFSTRHSMGPDAVMEPTSSIVQIPDEFYDRYSPARKSVIVVLVSYCAFLAPISSTSVLAATPEVAKEYDTTGTIINIVNALYMLFMGLSPMLWGPLSQVYGRRVVSGLPYLTLPSRHNIRKLGSVLKIVANDLRVIQ